MERVGHLVVAAADGRMCSPGCAAPQSHVQLPVCEAQLEMSDISEAQDSLRAASSQGNGGTPRCRALGPFDAAGGHERMARPQLGID